MNPDFNAAVAAVLRLRAEGAVRVKVGDVEAEWQAPPAPTDHAEPARPLDDSERREYEELLALRAQLEELPGYGG